MTTTPATSKDKDKKEDVVPHVSPEGAAAATIHAPGDPDFHPKVDEKAADNPVEDEKKVVASTRVIQTPEDACMAYLRQELDEKEFRAAFASLGGTPGMNSLPDDSAFERKIPDDLKKNPKSPYDDPEYARKVAEAKQKVRDAATEASEKISADKEVSSPAELAERKNAAAAEAAKKVVS